MTTIRPLMFVTALLGSSAALAGGPIQWSEIDDAPTFPHGEPQVTRGPGMLTSISGTTSSIDLHDAFCVRINDPASVVITTDPSVDPAATASFDTRLFLFNPAGRPLLFNDDTPPSTSPFASTLINATTDGSGYTFTQPGEYVLVITGFSEDPLDTVGTALFEQAGIFDLIHAANPAAGRFANWAQSPAQTGSYTIGMSGVSPCQNQLDLVGYAPDPDLIQACSGDSTGGFPICRTVRTNYTPLFFPLDLGYLDGDDQIDMVLGNAEPVTAVSDTERCLGDSNGGFEPCTLLDNGVEFEVDEVHLAHLNDDDLIDVIQGLGGTNGVRACLGDGLGGHSACSDVALPSAAFDFRLATAYLTPDPHLDLVIARFSSMLVCPGDGSGGFLPCQSIDIRAYFVDIADMNEDGHQDIVVTSDASPNYVCLNDGNGGFSCTEFDPESSRSRDLALADVNQDGHVDAVIPEVLGGSDSGRNEVCLGDGTGALSCSNISGVLDDYLNVDLGLLNDDPFVDIVFAASDLTRVCLGDGQGGFTCSNDASRRFRNVVLGELGQIADDLFDDGFE